MKCLPAAKDGSFAVVQADATSPSAIDEAIQTLKAQKADLL